VFRINRADGSFKELGRVALFAGRAAAANRLRAPKPLRANPKSLPSRPPPSALERCEPRRSLLFRSNTAQSPPVKFRVAGRLAAVDRVPTRDSSGGRQRHPGRKHLGEQKPGRSPDSPYLVLGDLTVEVAGSLTLEPGVVVLFPKTDVPGEGGDTRIELIVKGELKAEGTALLPITLRAQNEEFANSWHGVVGRHGELRPRRSSTSRFWTPTSASAARLREKSSSFRTRPCATTSRAFSLTDGSPAFDSVIFDENAVDGIYAEANAHSLSLSVTNCVFVLERQPPACT